MISLANKTGIEIIGLEAKNLFDFRAWNRLLKIIRSRHVDIIHSHHHRTGLLGRILVKFCSNAKVIHSFGNMYSKFSWYSRLAHILTVSLVDSFVCVSKSVENSFGKLEEKFLRNKKTLIYNGIDTSEVEREKANITTQREKLGVKSNEYLVGNVARLISLKDQKTLIQVIAKLNRDKTQVKLVIIGRGGLEQELKDLAVKLDLEKNVIFTGLVGREEVYRILHSLDLFVMTSLWDYSPFLSNAREKACICYS